MHYPINGLQLACGRHLPDLPAFWKSEQILKHAIVSAIEERAATNSFDTTKPVPDDLIRELVRLASRAPTAFNLQNWRFVAVRSPEAKARLRKVACDQAKVTEAAVTFILCGRLPASELVVERLQPSVEAGFMSPETVRLWEQAAKSLYAGQPRMQRDEAIRSATFGASTLILAAKAHGLSSCPMVGFDPDGVAREFALAADEVPVLLLAVGHAAPGNWPQKPRRPVASVLELV